jgi:hypothetical protein
MLAKIIYERLKPYVEGTLGKWQNGCRRDRPTIDNVFVLTNP